MYLLFIIFGIILYLLLNNIENIQVELDFDGTNHSVDITDLNLVDSSSFSLKDNGFEILNLVDNERIRTLTEQFYTHQLNLPPEINSELLELIKIYSLVNIEDDIKFMTSMASGLAVAGGGVCAPPIGGGMAAEFVSLPRKIPDTLMYLYNGNVYQMIAHDFNLRPDHTQGMIYSYLTHIDYYNENYIQIYRNLTRYNLILDGNHYDDFDISDNDFIIYNVWIPIHGNEESLIVNNGLTLADMSKLDNSDFINKDGSYLGFPVYSEKFNNDAMYSLIPQKLNDAYIFDTQKTFHGAFLNPEYTDDRSRVSIETRVACRLLNTIFVTFEDGDIIGATFPYVDNKMKISFNANRNEKFGDIPNNSNVLFVERGDELHNLKNMTRDIKRDVFSSRPLTLCILI